MIAWGLLDAFLGYQIFKLTVALWGAVLGGWAGHVAAVALGWHLAGQIGGVVAGALVGGGLAFLLFLGAVFVVGLLFGLTLGMLLFANFNPTVALLAGCGLGLISGFVALKLQKVILILATALLGSFRALLGLMFFTHRIDWAYYLLQQPQQIPALIESNAWLLPGTLTLAAAGAAAQFGLTGTDTSKKDRAGAAAKRK